MCAHLMPSSPCFFIPCRTSHPCARLSYNRPRPTRPMSKPLVKSLAALIAANGWTGGMNKHGDFGGPLCAEPYGDEVQSLVKRLLADSENDKSLAFNNFTDPCPELTKKRLQTMKGVRLCRQEEEVALWPSALVDRVSCSWTRDSSRTQRVRL